jgi:hypothetical protein
MKHDLVYLRHHSLWADPSSTHLPQATEIYLYWAYIIILCTIRGDHHLPHPFGLHHVFRWIGKPNDSAWPVVVPLCLAYDFKLGSLPN